MEQHPVPQNVTTFQFRLIGDMTIKQFGYLAGGAILAYISYKLPLPFFFTWPLTILFAAGGVGFAFVPIEERPMDIWVMSFLKNVYSPTMFVWEKSAMVQQASAKTQTPAPAPHVQSPAMAPQRVQVQPAPVQNQTNKTKADVISTVYRQTAPPQQQPVQYAPVAPAPKKNGGLFDWIASLFSPGAPKPPPVSTVMHSAAHVANPSVTGTHMDFSMPPTVTRPDHPAAANKPAIAEVEKQEETLNAKVNELKHELEHSTQTSSRILELQKQLTEVLAQKDKMEAEVIALRRQMAPQQPPATTAQPIPAQTIKQPAPVRSGPTVKIITPESAVKAGLPRLTTFPNVVTGITKDGENNMLPGVLVTVKDKDGIPVRALKTNRLGQFAASTPLANGVYFVEIEDPRARYSFDRVQITLNGSIVPALEIIAKSQREISRAKLEKEIFGTQTS